VTEFTLRNRRRSALRQQGGVCFWCDDQLLSYKEAGSPTHPRLCTADHLTPRSLGGSNEGSNIVAACFKCNSARKDNVLEIWLSRIKFRLKQSGNPQHFDVILSRLWERGIRSPFAGHPSNGPGTSRPADSPPLKDLDPAP
jgi:hypothetical protein